MGLFKEEGCICNLSHKASGYRRYKKLLFAFKNGSKYGIFCMGAVFRNFYLLHLSVVLYPVYKTEDWYLANLVVFVLIVL